MTKRPNNLTDRLNLHLSLLLHHCEAYWTDCRNRCCLIKTDWLILNSVSLHIWPILLHTFLSELWPSGHNNRHNNIQMKLLLCIYVQEIAHIMFKPQEPNNPHFIQIITLVCVCVCVSTPSCHVALVLYLDILSSDDWACPACCWGTAAVQTPTRCRDRTCDLRVTEPSLTISLKTAHHFLSHLQRHSFASF